MSRQFASGSSSVQRLVVITVRDLATVATGSTAAALTGAVVTIIGTSVEAAVSAATQVKATVPVSTVHPLRFCFDYRKSRLLQLLIQRGKIGFEQFAPRLHRRSDFCIEIRDGGVDRSCRCSI
jgi:hypothetical protein